VLQQNMARNRLQNTVTVVHKMAEHVDSSDIPEKVDVIISETFGYLAVFERALESWLLLRDRFLKPGGHMYPALARIYVATSSNELLWASSKRTYEYLDSSPKELHGFDVSLYAKEELKQINRNVGMDFTDKESVCQISKNPHVQDYRTMKISELQHFDVPLLFPPLAKDAATIYELVAWFDFDFKGSQSSVTVSTGPLKPRTHWNQVHLTLIKPIDLTRGDSGRGKLSFSVNSKRGYEIKGPLQRHPQSIFSMTKFVCLQGDIFWSTGARTTQIWAMDEESEKWTADVFGEDL
jgi:histone-arginine methyltransferase CARM1